MFRGRLNVVFRWMVYGMRGEGIWGGGETKKDKGDQV